MASGHALTDEDRAPWLERVAAAVVSELQKVRLCFLQRLLHAAHAVEAQHSTCCCACSALKVKYRNMLRERISAGFSGADVRFVLLAVEAATLQGTLPATPRELPHH
jgi:gluconate kinase